MNKKNDSKSKNSVFEQFFKLLSMSKKQLESNKYARN